MTINPKREARRRFAVPMADGRGRLAMLVRKLEGQLMREYRPKTVLARHRVRRAAQLMALGDQVMAQIGKDPKASRRQATALTFAAERVLANLQQDRRPLTPAQERKQFARDLRKQNKGLT